MKFFLILLIFTSSAFAQSNKERLDAIKEVKRLAFDSCNKQHFVQPLWKDLMNMHPDLFIWGDYHAFKKFVPITGTWDDHDYDNDNNDANGNYFPKLWS